MNVNPTTPDVTPDATHDVTIAIFGAAVRPDGQPSATLRHRVEAAIRFGRRHANPAFIPTGAIGRHGDAESVVMERMLLDAGFPPESIRTEQSGTDTLSSAVAIKRMLPPDTTVHVCTSAYHMPRCMLLMRLADVKTRACPPPPEPASRSFALRWYWRLREVPAIPYDALLMIWQRVQGTI
jgi:vancomycin permeability regulator SanA